MHHLTSQAPHANSILTSSPVCAGLTSRPAWTPAQGSSNPYDAPAQAQLLLAFCDALGIRTATLVGHSDGAVPVVLAAAAAARYAISSRF